VLDGATTRRASWPLQGDLQRSGSAHLCRNRGLAV